MVLYFGIVGVLSIVVGWFVTARMFALARRTGGVPERLLASGFGELFCLGYPLVAASRAPSMVLTNEGSLLFAIGMIGIVLGIAAFARFPYIVFRPGSRAASMSAALIGIAGLIAGVGCTVAVASAYTRQEMIANIQPWAVLLMAALCASFLWNAIESFLYYGNMKRRLALGLADPETTHRFFLWAFASVAAAVSVFVVLVLRALGTPILSPIPMLILSLSSLTSSACWWLAFFMPVGYRTRVLGVTPTVRATND